jgi:hypothetical protein
MTTPTWGPNPTPPEKPKKNHTGLKVFAGVFTGLVAFTLLIVLGFGALVSNSGDSGDTPKKEDRQSQPEHPDNWKKKQEEDAPNTNSQNKVHPPADDVGVGPLVDKGYGYKEGSVNFKNNSSETSDYTVEVRYLNAQGTQVGNDYAASNAVKPGATATSKLYGAPDDATKVEVTNVDRFATKY